MCTQPEYAPRMYITRMYINLHSMYISIYILCTPPCTFYVHLYVHSIYIPCTFYAHLYVHSIYILCTPLCTFHIHFMYILCTPPCTFHIHSMYILCTPPCTFRIHSMYIPLCTFLLCYYVHFPEKCLLIHSRTIGVAEQGKGPGSLPGDQRRHLFRGGCSFRGRDLQPRLQVRRPSLWTTLRGRGF